jgi:fructose 1,6-bisphosphate aldolase/phosphatase
MDHAILTYDKEARIPMSEYYESRNDLDGMPITTLEKVPVTNVPNIFSYKSHIFVKHPELVQRFVKATKADIGGVGGHVVAAEEVKSVVAQFIMERNRYNGEPIFTSFMVTHTGDDIGVTGIISERIATEAVDELLWDAFMAGTVKAEELGLYGPGQDLIADAFTGNLHGSGPATILMPLPVRKENPSQTVLVSFADKTEPFAFNYYAMGAYANPRFNTGLLIASSKMKRGFIFEIVDVDTKAQAIESGVHPNDAKGLEDKMDELSKAGERVITLRSPEDFFDLEGLTKSSRYVVARIYSRNENDEKGDLGYIVSAERLHNIKTSKGFTYGGKDDPVLLALAQSDWPAPGEITSPWANVPVVPGDCRGSHGLHIFPVPLNWQTSFWSGPIVCAVTLSLNIHTGRIGALSDQFALGTPWDWVRQQAAASMIQFRTAHGTRQPATLHEDELEYQEGWKERKRRLEKEFEVRSVHTNGAGAVAIRNA